MAKHAKHIKQEPKRAGSGVAAKIGAFWYVLFTVVVVCALAVPFVAMPFAPYNPDAEMQELKEFPEIVADGKPNADYLAQAGDWFNDHFAFRQQLMFANAQLQAKVFGVSPTKQVIVGTDGWLYYAGTLSDYQREGTLTDRGMDNAAYNLKLAKEYIEKQGAKFAVAIAPNKNSIEPEHMPYYLVEGEGETGLDAFSAKLDEYGVAYADLYEMLEEQHADGQSLYMKTDTHWTGEGARLSYVEIMGALGRADEAPSFKGRDALHVDEQFEGDIERMLYPLYPSTEPYASPENSQEFKFKGSGSDASAAVDVTSSTSVTVSESPDASGNIVMYRDSFGNSLLPYFATAYKNGYFTKMVPYNLVDAVTYKATDVVVERAERHLSFFAESPAIFPALERSALKNVKRADDGDVAEVTWKENGPYLQVQGTISPELVDDDAKFFVLIESEKRAASPTDASNIHWYEASHMTMKPAEGSDDEPNDYGFMAYIKKDSLPKGQFYMRVCVQNEDSGIQVYSSYIQLQTAD